ncbi:conserved membrane hypothetical protein [Vibrio nigripulchritudo SO65]|uniref:hypothetical protein n=1 Tax=Vibrio nigripulchritudo TaxID=28173 RepID=UPI0003B1FC85|nr:hypothetical protein [Vibrio nigripulchritudo]CCN38496.1 conserved membrane hypothetical protein [Vibrio nigripulchritudo AM115]CCN42439.1 conserved membrane hypothetical protein [Vibrio nigripulchritudo FTn2]CCN67170.1 conserved membrane hypothetical protein [Vibrio nigripulchritudo POn4]CCN76765.1 conserved membrane hypothetical protein [Vibrio nigripulchritudo SO65]
MSTRTRYVIPFAFFFVVCLFWSYFYLTSGTWIHFPSDKPEWFLLVDGLIALPLLCYLCIKDKKQATTVAMIYFGAVVTLGSFILPASSKFLWSYLEYARYLIVPLFLIFEGAVLATVILMIRQKLNYGGDPDRAISQPLEDKFGKNLLTKWAAFEIRVWAYALFSQKIAKTHFLGEKHFSYHQKDGAQSNVLGFILIIVFEIPFTHILLHFLINPLVANVVTVLTLAGMHFMIAEYKALSRRPISLGEDRLYIRYGVIHSREIEYAKIRSVQLHDQAVKSNRTTQVLNLSGVPNVRIVLRSGNLIYLGVDCPAEFVENLSRRIRNG